MAMAAQEKGQEEEEEEEENPTKSNATRCTTRYRTHVSPPKSYRPSRKIERKKQTTRDFFLAPELARSENQTGKALLSGKHETRKQVHLQAKYTA